MLAFTCSWIRRSRHFARAPTLGGDGRSASSRYHDGLPDAFRVVPVFLVVRGAGVGAPGQRLPELCREGVADHEIVQIGEVIPIDSSADLIDGVNDPGIAGQGGETPDLVT